MSTKQQLEDARLLIKTFVDAIDKGYTHYDKAGNHLDTVEKILVALTREGTVEIRTPTN